MQYLRCLLAIFLATSAQADFETSWEDSTGTSDAALRDGTNWDGTAPLCGAATLLNVVVGGAAGAPDAPNGSNIMEVSADGDTAGSCESVTEAVFWDMFSHNNYLRFYEYLECDSDHLDGHYMQDGPAGDGTDNEVWDYNGSGFPGAGAVTHTGFFEIDSTDSAGDCQSNGQWAAMQANRGDSGDPTKPCDLWHREEMWFECPNDDNCQDGTGDTGLRIHKKTYECTTGVGGPTDQCTLILDDSDYRMHEFDDGFSSAGKVFSNGTDGVYDPTGSGGKDTCFAWKQGQADMNMGPNGQAGTPAGPFIQLYWDAVKQTSGDIDDAYIGPDCEAEPAAPECAGGSEGIVIDGVTISEATP